MKKQCTKCGVKKALDFFGMCKKNNDGRTYYCRECVKQYDAARYAANPEYAARRNKEWVAANRERHAASNKAWIVSHREHHAKKKALWGKVRYATNPANRVMMIKAWRIANPNKFIAQVVKRYAAKLNAAPPWVDLAELAKIYERAAKRGLTVDHIIPLQHPLVCGLHVPWNLRPLSRSKNSAKGNRWEQP